MDALTQSNFDELSDIEFEAFWIEILDVFNKSTCIDMLRYYFKSQKPYDLPILINMKECIIDNRVSKNDENKSKEKQLFENELIKKDDIISWYYEELKQHNINLNDMDRLKRIKFNDLYFIDNLHDKMRILFQIHHYYDNNDWSFIDEIETAKQNLLRLDLDFLYNDNVELNKDRLQFWLLWDVELPQYFDLFNENNIFLISTMKNMDYNKLQQVGIDNIDHILRILKCIKRLKNKKTFITNQLKQKINEIEKEYNKCLQIENKNNVSLMKHRVIQPPKLMNDVIKLTVKEKSISFQKKHIEKCIDNEYGPSALQIWLNDIKMSEYYPKFVLNGYTFLAIKQNAGSTKPNDFKFLGENTKYMDQIKLSLEVNKLSIHENVNKYKFYHNLDLELNKQPFGRYTIIDIDQQCIDIA